MRTRLWLLFTAVLGAAAPVSFDASRFLRDIEYLASPELKGRETGSPELEQAARFIEVQFRAAGLNPVRQTFPVTTAAKLGKGNRFEYTLKGANHPLVEGKQFLPFNFSHSGQFSGGVVFAGYGLTQPGYDDYKGLDVHGRIVLVLGHEPKESPHEPKLAYTKAANARAHGAKAVIFVRDALHHPGDADQLAVFGHNDGPADAGIPFVQVQETVAKTWFDLERAEHDIDTTQMPHSFIIRGLEVRESVDLERAVRNAANVTAYLPGETSEYVVIGAHYDHLGLGEQFSLAPSLAGTIHPGADDNASGTAGVLELARSFSNGPKRKRGFLFMTFAGEEQGLLGSGYYVNHPLFPLENAAAMINLDMIGRVRDGKIYIGGTGTGSTLRPLLDSLIGRHPALKPDYSEAGGYGSSDHTSFTTKQIPVLFFFSGLHADYHKPSDTADKINAAAAVDVLGLVADTAERLASDSDRPVYRKVAEPRAPGGGSGGGYGPYFGSIPDFAEPPKGVRFADVREGSPAALAGLKGGDILVRFGEQEINNLYDFTDALRAHKVGDEVPVQVLRGGSALTVKVKLAERR